MEELQPSTPFQAGVAVTLSLEAQSVTLTETTEVKWTRFVGEVQRITLSGSCELAELSKMANIEQIVSEHSGRPLVMALVTKQGEPFPMFPNITRLGYQDLQNFQHLPGEVLLVLVLSAKKSTSPEAMLNNLQQILTKAFECYDKFRAAAIWIEASPASVLMPLLEQKWSALQHWALSSGDGESEIIRRLDGSTTPQAYLVDQSGLLVASFMTPEALRLNLERRLDSLFGKGDGQRIEPSDTGDFEEFDYQLSEESWNKITDKFTLLASLGNQLRSCGSPQFYTKSVRTFKKGLVATKYWPLTVRYQLSESQNFEPYQALMKRIVEDLPPRSVIYEQSAPDDQDIQLRFTYDKIKEFLEKHDLKGEPVVLVINKLDLLDDNGWTAEKCVGSVQLDYHGPETVDQVKGFLRDMKIYHQQTNLDKLYVNDKELPFKITEVPFLGLPDLQDYRDGFTNKSITNQLGKVQFILMLNRSIAEANHKCIRMFAQVVTKNQQQASLHIISVDGKLSILEELIQQNYAIQTYRADPNTNLTVKAMWESSWHCCLLVNREGQLAGIDQMNSAEQIEEVIADPNAYDQGISQQLCTRLTTLMDDDLFKKTQADLKALPYRPMVKLTYVQEKTNQQKTLKITRAPTLTLCMREQDKHLILPLLQSLGIQKGVQRNYRETVELPERACCTSCSVETAIPYYYFFTTKAYRCIRCAIEQDDEGVENLLKYKFTDNSVLVLGDRYLNVLRLGDNIQPRSEPECKFFQFKCMACDQSKNQREPFHICVGCWDRNESQCVLVCCTCVTALTSNDEALKKSLNDILGEASKVHEPGHLLLRMLYSPRTPSEF